MEHPGLIEGLNPQAQKILSPDAPPQLRGMAAAGLAPLSPKDMVCVLYFLSYDSDTSIADKARASLVRMPEKILLEILSQTTSEWVLDGVARILLASLNAIERIILNQATTGETIQWLAGKLHSEKHLEMIAANERRMLAWPKIIEALYNNRAARMSTVERAIELAIRNGIELEGIAAFEEVKKAIEGQLIPEPPDEGEVYPDDIGFTSVLQAQVAEAVDESVVSDVLEALESGVDGELKAEKEKVEELKQSLSELNISGKIRVATLGNASQRAVLIRDSNKLVIMAVLKSPALSDSEIMRYSAARSLPDEAVRYICSKREWVKHYSVKVNLVNNPKTPVSEAMRFLNHLRPNDIRSLERSKDISGVVKNAARELRRKRTE